MRNELGFSIQRNLFPFAPTSGRRKEFIGLLLEEYGEVKVV